MIDIRKFLGEYENGSNKMFIKWTYSDVRSRKNHQSQDRKRDMFLAVKKRNRREKIKNFKERNVNNNGSDEDCETQSDLTLQSRFKLRQISAGLFL